MTAEPVAGTVDVNIGPVANPFARWPNDDLLLSAASRTRVAELAPDLAGALDWPELRDLFVRHDALANAARRANLRTGGVALAISAFGLLVGAAMPVVAPPGAGRAFQLVSLAALTLGFALGLWHLFGAREKSRWLVNRFWTERLRQLYFQFAVNHVDLAAQSAHDPSAAEALRAARAAALDAFTGERMRDVSYSIDQLAADEAEVSPWINPHWERPAVTGTDQARIVDLLARQRIRVQLEYTRKKLRPGFYSPATRSAWISALADAATFAIVVLNIVLGVRVWHYEIALDGAEFIWWTAANALLGVTIAILKKVDSACQFTVEAERFGWYLASVEEIDRRFAVADSLTEKIAALRDLERLSYQELRRFIVTHRAARFLL